MEVQKIPKRTVTLIEPKKSILVDKEKYHQKRVAAYCRVSTDSEEQLTSYQNQMRVYTEMIAARKEWEFAGLYADEGISGTRADKRPEFQRMIRDCQNGKIDYIITKSVSRFARNTVECLEYIRSLKAQGIGIFFEEQNIDTLKSDSELYLVIYAGFAQSESESISKHITWTYRKNFEDGKVSFQYKRLLGYRKGEDGKPEIVPEETVVIRRIYQRYLDGCSEGQIAKELDGDGTPTAKGVKAWSHQVIHSILCNEKYIGDALLQKTYVTDCITKQVKKNNGELPQYYIENNHPAIVPRNIYQQVREEMTRRASKRKVMQKSGKTEQGKYSGKYALSEKLICGECGTPYKRCTWARNGEKRIVWRCISRLEFGKKYCHESPTMPEDKLQNAILTALNRAARQNSEFHDEVLGIACAAKCGPQDSTVDLPGMERRLEELDEQQNRLLDRVLANMADTTLTDQLKELADEKQALTDAISAAKADALRKANQETRVEGFREFIAQNSQGFTQYDDEVVRKLVERITVIDAETIRVRLRDSDVEIEQTVC